MKRTLSTLTVCLLLFTFIIPCVAFAESESTRRLPDYEEFNEAYISFTIQLEEYGYSPITSLEVFVQNYVNSEYTSLDEYIQIMIDEELLHQDSVGITNITDSTGNVSTQSTALQAWFDNIGSTLDSIDIRSKPDYSTIDFRLHLAPGDIIYDTRGIITTITGHIAIIQGRYYSTQHNMYYLRTIEAGPSGVVFGVFDYTRYSTRISYVYCVPSATDTQIASALAFCDAQRTKGYNSLGALGSGSCNTSILSTSWYCSELVWAAYYYAGINLYGTTVPNNLYTPYALSCSSKLTLVYTGS